MSTNFPSTSIDTFPTHSTGDVIQASFDNNEQDAIVALETKVGVNGSADTDSLDYKLSGVTGSDKSASLAGTEALTNKTLTAPVITSPTLNLGSDAEGDTYYRNGAGALVRLAKGTDNYIYKMNGNVPNWEAEAVVSDATYASKGIVQGLTDASTSGLTIASGVISVNSGTGANNIVKLNSSSQIPAVSGALLTDISYISALTTVSPTTSTNTDTVITCGFTPTTITILYDFQGYTSSSARFSSGHARYNSSGTLIVNDAFYLNSTGITGLSKTFDTTAPFAGAVGGTYIIGTMTIVSVTSTGFTVRITTTQSGAPTFTGKFVAIATR